MPFARHLLSGLIVVAMQIAVVERANAESPVVPDGSDSIKSKQIADMLNDLHQAHIIANTPPADLFDKYLQRDLDDHFSWLLGKKVKTDHELLQKEAMQIGIGHPYYYFWVKVMDAETGVLLDQGFLSAKAVDKTQFVIGSLIRSEDICAKDNPFKESFREGLYAVALEHARAAMAENKTNVTQPSVSK